MSSQGYWSRRDVIKTLLMGAPAAAAMPSLWGCSDAAEEEQLKAILAETGPMLDRALPQTLLDASAKEVELGLKVISGKLPADITGHVFVVAALPWRDGSMIFNGDGIMYRLDLGVMGGARVKTRIAKSPCYWADKATVGKPEGFGNAGVTRMSGALGVRNELNTAYMAMGDRMLVTYDGGRPWEIDVNTLELITPVGQNSEWRSSIPFVQGPFKPYLSTAHPFYDQHAEEIFTINYGPNLGEGNEPFTDLMRWDGQGQVLRWTILDDQGAPIEIKQSVHQMAITEDYVVIVDCAFLVENEQLFNSNIIHTQEPDALLHIVSRADLKADATSAPARTIIIPREIVHLTADYENPDGKITLYVAHNNATDASEWVRPDDVRFHDGKPIDMRLVGFITSCTDLNSVGKYVIDAKAGKLLDERVVKDDDYTWAVGFYSHAGQTPAGRLEHVFFNSVGMTDETLTSRIVELYRDHPYRDHEVSKLPTHRPGTLFHFDPSQAAITDGYIFPAGRFGSSPQFVPRQNAKHGADGYVVCTVVSDDKSWAGSSGDEFWIFDAQNLRQGPLARLGHPELDMGFTLHTSFLPELKARRSDYKLDIRQDYKLLLAEQSEPIKALFEQEVFPHFD